MQAEACHANGKYFFRRRYITWRLKKKVQEVLAREKGTVYKDPGGRVRVCLAYPNSYSLGMTNLGFQMVYKLLNDIERCVAERAFLPAKDEIDEFVRTGTPLFSHESQTSLKEFDIIAFSIPFEDDYTNIPAILKLAGIPVFASERRLRPLVMAGGVAVSLNPEPLADIADIFSIGEGEGSLSPVLDIFRDCNERGFGKEETLAALDSVEWVYVPSLYGFEYDGAVITGVKKAPYAKSKVKAAKNFDLDKYEIPRNFIQTPETEFKNTALIEIERGCGRGCRFCAAGFLYLPPRWRSSGAVNESVRKGIEACGKVGLIGTAVSEYPGIKETLSLGAGLKGTMTLSSLRMDSLDAGLIELLKKAGYKTVTLAPEAGTQRMRRVVNKGIDEVEILESVRLIADAGFLKMKLYFLVGLPGEEDEDAAGIVGLAGKIRSIMKRGELTLSINPFIPKPFTPFQWHAFEAADTVDRRLGIIRKGLAKDPAVKINALQAKEAFIQAYISRADRRAGALIMEASDKGWRRAAKANSEFINGSVYRQRAKEEILPWDMIDHGVGKGYLWKEYRKGLEEALTPPCDVGACFRCGVCRPEDFRR